VFLVRGAVEQPVIRALTCCLLDHITHLLYQPRGFPSIPLSQGDVMLVSYTESIFFTARNTCSAQKQKAQSFGKYLLPNFTSCRGPSCLWSVAPSITWADGVAASSSLCQEELSSGAVTPRTEVTGCSWCFPGCVWMATVHHLSCLGRFQCAVCTTSLRSKREPKLDVFVCEVFCLCLLFPIKQLGV